MLRARNAHLNAAVNSSVQNVLHEQRVNILDDIFGQRPCPHTRFAGQKNNLYNGKG